MRLESVAKFHSPKSPMMSIREINLTKEQHDWLNGWLELWGAWVYSGRLEKRMSSVIAEFMAKSI